MSDSTEKRSLPLSASLRKPLNWLLALTALPLVGMLVALAFVYPIIAAKIKPPLPLLLLIGPLILVLVTSWLYRSLARAGVAVDHGDLVVNMGLGSKRVPLAHLRARGVRAVDLSSQRELRPWLRMWGTGLPGFRGGWFKLRNGEKAVCLMFDSQRVSYLRSETDNLSLLLSLAEPDVLRRLLER